MTPDTIDPVIAEAVESVLGQVATLRVTGITYIDQPDQGTLAHVAIEGGTHEILCELAADGRLLSARVMEL